MVAEFREITIEHHVFLGICSICSAYTDDQARHAEWHAHIADAVAAELNRAVSEAQR
jgi:predicted secreted Zn-dependent protease